MRIAIGGFSHETNTFNPQPTTLQHFLGPTGQAVDGSGLVSAYEGSRTVLGGMIDGLRAAGMELAPTFFTTHGPTTGKITAEAIDYVLGRVVESVAVARADGVLLHLHGAAASESIDDPEGECLRRVRQVIGASIPLVVVHDLHANIGPAWAEHADAIIGYKTAPHVDYYERGYEGAALIARILTEDIRVHVALRKPRVLVKSGLMSVTDTPLAVIKPPMYWLMSRARERERDPRVYNVTVAAGFGDADVPEAGISVVANTADPSLSAEIAEEIAALAWKLRRGFETDAVMTPVAVAVSRAMASPKRPVMLADQGNNTAGGSPGDGTVILAALKDAGWPSAALFIRDEAAVAESVRAGIGGEIEFAVGGKLEPTNGDPVRIRGRVRLLSTGGFRSVRSLQRVEFGRTAVVECGETEIVLTERPTSQIHPQYFRSVGIEPREKQIVVVQSAHLFRDAFEAEEHIPAMVLEVDTPGITSPDTRRFTYRKVTRPIFPLDPD